MYPFLKSAHRPQIASLSYYSNLIDHCLSLKSLCCTKSIHAQLIKVGLNGHTFLGNRCLDLYSQFGTPNDALLSFHDISSKNSFTWNICLKGLFRFGGLESASSLFDQMPERDVVSWNSMISGYISYGFIDYALRLFLDMQSAGVRPSEFTFSILTSVVSSAYHGKQIHCSMLRGGMDRKNVVLGNSLIDMYGKLGLLDYAFGVFSTMEELDIISWNSLILGCLHSGYGDLALQRFCSMITSGLSPDQFTISTVISVCSDLRALEKDLRIQFGYLKR